MGITYSARVRRLALRNAASIDGLACIVEEQDAGCPGSVVCLE